MPTEWNEEQQKTINTLQKQIYQLEKLNSFNEKYIACQEEMMKAQRNKIDEYKKYIKQLNKIDFENLQ